MASLADQVLPCIRTRSELYSRSMASAHGQQMHAAIDVLEEAVGSGDPAEVYAVTQKALASALKVIMRADDSDGIIGDACQRLLALHPVAAAGAGVPAGKLVSWMIKFQFEDECDYFEIDPVTYMPALGERGMVMYRARLAEVRELVGPSPPDRNSFSAPFRRQRWVLDHNDQRLAVLDRDEEAIVRTHLRGGKVAASFSDTASAFEEIEEFDLAVDWARRGVEFDLGWQARRAGEQWCRMLAAHRPGEELSARLEVFCRWPFADEAARLRGAAGESWPEHQAMVMDALAANPREAVVFALGTLKEADTAWQLAQSLQLSDDRVWHDLINAYEKVDPIAVLPQHQRLVEEELRVARAQNYQFAARRLARMRVLASGTDSATRVDGLIAELREKHKRRPRLQEEFDRVGLP